MPRAVPVLMLVLLTACSSSSATTAAGTDGPIDAVRVAMPVDSPAPAPQHSGDRPGNWVHPPGGRFASLWYPGGAPTR